MPLTTEQRRRNEASIRAAMDRLLLGQLPARGGCNLKTLAREAGVARTGFYARTDPQGNQRPGPYQHLAEEFQRRLADLREAGAVSDPRELQITRDHARSAQSAVNGIAAVPLIWAADPNRTCVLATHPALHVAWPVVSRCWLPVRWSTESGSELRGSGSGSVRS
ncbi:hypothetical protein ACFYVW_30940 [Streptomyces tendae]|uniref:hypothetical protein n=1 Tax=Streptomyces tendae TaxID=1932 RepID=UPI0036AF3207